MVKKVHVIGNYESGDSVIDEIIDNGQDEGFYVCDIGSVIKQYELWNECLPRVQPYYAVKCNNDANVLQALADIGANFDCASNNEIEEVLAIGVSADRIIFSNTIKSRKQLLFAKSQGVNLTTVDNDMELEKIKKNYPDAKLLIRLKWNDPTATYNFGNKFGVDSKTEAEVLLNRAFQLGLNVVGVHFHIGSGSRNFTVFQEALIHARHLFDISSAAGHEFDILDIGGGFNGDDNDKFKFIAAQIGENLDRYFPNDSVKIISEPGRFFVTNSFTLISRVLSVRRFDDKVAYYIDDGLFGSFLGLKFNEKIHPAPLKEKGEPMLPSAIWGPTCAGIDRVSDDCLLPSLNEGDWIKFENMGAYTLSLATKFNGFTASKVYHFIRKFEQYKMKSESDYIFWDI